MLVIVFNLRSVNWDLLDENYSFGAVRIAKMDKIGMDWGELVFIGSGEGWIVLGKLST